MKDPCQILVEHELGALSDAQLIEWACEVLSTDGPLADDRQIADLAALNPRIESESGLAGIYFRPIIDTHHADFSLKSPDGIRWARETLKQRCDDYIKKRITPYEFCRVVSPVEQHFDYPEWLCDLYNACDWIDGNTKRENVPHLADEARKVYNAA